MHIASYMGAIECVSFVITTIQLTPQTRSRLAELKQSPRESYDEVLTKLLSLVPEGDEEGEYTQPFRVALLRARLEIREGRTLSHAQLKRRLGL
jgi:hypothetical protein